MSSLIFYTDEAQALVATDTLATISNTEGNPLKLTTKAFILPHLRAIFAGAGLGGFLGSWLMEVNDNLCVKGVINLDYHTPDALRRLWREWNVQHVPDYLDATITVYHFGFSEEDGLLHSYAYRSANDFQSEPLPYGLHVKPECAVPENYQLPDDLELMMLDQRLKQAKLPPAQRVYIGGEIILYHLSPAGFRVLPLARFADYDLMEQAIYRQFDQT